MVYEEIVPQALALMTDVFGNYVIQKVSASSSVAYLFSCIILWFIVFTE